MCRRLKRVLSILGEGGLGVLKPLEGLGEGGFVRRVL